MRPMALVVLFMAIGAVACATPAWPASAGERVVNFYNWSDYIDETVLADFERETGIEVRYDVYDSNDMLETKLLAGKTGYDVVVPTSYYLARQIAAGVLAKLDKGKLGNLKHMDTLLMRRLGKYDPGNAHAVIYLWGTTGIAINKDKIAQRMADAPVDSLKMLFDPDIVARFADCGVALLDAPDEIVPATLRYLGLDPDAKDQETLDKAEAQLRRVRPFIRRFHSSQYINDLANGDICLAFGWSGDVLQAKSRAAEAGNNVRIGYAVPREGAQQWFDVLAIPKDAPHKIEAHVLIDYLMRPEQIAKITNRVRYPNGNKAALNLVAKDVAADGDVFPPPQTIATLFSVTPYDHRQQRALTRLWTRIKGESERR
jgi:putrescine transport system substrate-binding protein